ncbi:MAG TPA: DUF3566 domain-containing protein [Dongiaceae bacterium]|nr:DUF3566 domain-containing protein [Dongiaceae bacterium]
MHVLKSVGVMSVAEISGFLYGCVGLLVAPLFLLIGFFGTLAGHNNSAFTGVITALLIPFLYGVLGFFMGAIGAFLYNLLSDRVGGIELELVL